MDYTERLKKVTDYIGQHLDDDLSLERLSDVACFSKHHFHRIFTAMTGLSLYQYVRWLRLKRASYQLLHKEDKSIIDIAVQAGFESHEAFTRAYKKQFNRTPSETRSTGINPTWTLERPYVLPHHKGKEMKVEIRQNPSIRLAMLEHVGDPALVPETVNQLIAWAKSQTIDLKPKAGNAFGLAYDDPKTTPKANFRFGLGIKVPEQYELNDPITECYLPAGRYAVATHYGSHDNIADTVYGLYRDWLPSTNESLGELPCIFSYQNFEHEVPETELVTECWLQLKD